MHVYPSSKNKDAFRPEKRSVPKRIHKTFGDWQRFLETNHESVFVGKTCGETFGLVRFVGAGAGCGVRVRVRFTCGQTFARTPGSDKNTILLAKC